ncbi:putative uncharacterized protein [Mycolicibacterium novocastrense]|uniref:Uncharacterized protein n=1 Tax=Mycolicibacterium novocastrense TaxID=59813 RepID=A0ABQ0KG24_MYCNV|nr:putative uncharacterized protein [Mycolicibacterium novocastrense]
MRDCGGTSTGRRRSRRPTAYNRPIEIYGVTVEIASLADVIRAEQAANRPKDQRVLPTLREPLARRDERR